jgi:hypothetical protein
MASNAKTTGSTHSSQQATTIEEREQNIRDRAYQIYLQRGAQPGYELEDWLQAERELNEQSSS